MSQSLKQRYAWSALFGSNAGYIEDMYASFMENPDSVPENWRAFFDQLGTEHTPAIPQRAMQQALVDGTARKALPRASAPVLTAANEKQAAVARLIQVYRLRGHQIADLDPLGLTERRMPAVLKPDYLGLTEADMDTRFYTGGLAGCDDQRLP
ncbi:MAG TPA: 2-oxoglutarate dehydrogenase E1 component, partial [Chromatiales bacterium]|nr:2-oxoglutarate dehydrogenase E1 component [Chromatiales bacterium]